MDEPVPRQLRAGVFEPVRIDPAGVTGPTPKAARGPSWRRSSHGRHVPARVPLTLEQRIVEAAAMLPAHGAVTGWAALAWRGGRWLDGLGVQLAPKAVPLMTAGDDIRPQPGISVSAEGLDPRLIEVVDGVRVTTAVHAVLFEMRRAATPTDAVRALDMAAYSDLVSIDEARAFADTLSGREGIPLAREAIEQADENAWSPVEVDLRLLLGRELGLTSLLCNRPVFDLGGSHVNTPDLLDGEHGVAFEYEGGGHLEREQRVVDLGREDDYRKVGIVSVTVVAADLATPRRVVERTRAAQQLASELGGDRLWTLEMPHWWVPTWTVAQRRALDTQQRRTWLGRRAA